MADRASCGTCAHVERAAIELALAGGASLAAVGRKYKIGREAVRNHWRKHVSPERKASLVLGPVQRAALAARVAEESESVLDHHRITRSGLYALYDAAVTAGDRVTGAMLAGRLTEVNNSIARLTGQLATSPLIQQTTINNNLHTSDEYLRLRDGLLQLGRAHPEVRTDLIALLKRLDGAPEPINPPIDQPALIEHKESTDA